MEIKGFPASKGTICGIVNRNRSFDVQPGEILVVPMTDINYFSSMKKAAAIVTFEGGSLCHAAIISRELKKPCVVGIGNEWSSILKDGKHIKVDGLLGIVSECEENHD
jgi:pyruvate,water dikinase